MVDDVTRRVGRANPTTEGIEATGERAAPRSVGIWLLVVAALVFAMVVLGGVTRLTQSGLSIVDWDPIMGAFPPITQEQWGEVFAEYREFPEYSEVNDGMTLREFEEIFWIEWAHRFVGRLIGLALIIPTLWFGIRRAVGRRLFVRLLAIFGLVALEGVLGWFMVASGLVDVPRVSPVRLSAHLVLATIIFGTILWTALDVLLPRAGPPGSKQRRPRSGWALLGFILLVMVSGGFVAGTKSGFAYNTFPLMGGRVVPEGLLRYDPLWDNFLENSATVQFQHRILAISLFVTVLAFAVLLLRRSPERRVAIAVWGLIGAALLQVTLGVSTLLLEVPTALAAAHQACALALFGIALFIVHESGEAEPPPNPAPPHGDDVDEDSELVAV